MKIKILTIWAASFLIFFPSVYASVNKNIEFQLPVRLFDGGHPVPLPSKKNLQLIINNEPRRITSVQYQQKSIGTTPELGRYFILSFQITEFNKKIKKRISYLITEILNNRDTLIIISPRNIYQYQTYANKDRMIRDIHSILDRDFSKYQKGRRAAEKNLKTKINRLNQVYQRARQSRGPFLETVGFLNTFPTEFFTYYRYFLSPVIDKYKQVIKKLQTMEGQRWCIHFHDHKIYNLFFNTAAITGMIYGYINSWPWRNEALRKALFGKLIQFRKQLSITTFYLEDSLMNVILSGDINFNIVFFLNSKEIASKISRQLVSNIEGLLRRVARNSGGLAVYAKNDLKGMKTIKDHRDHFYNLGFSFNHKIEQKNIQILIKHQNQSDIYHRNLFEADEIESMLDHHQEKKVNISNFEISKRSIHFMVRSFQLNPIHNTSEIFGLLRIKIQILDSKQTVVFESKKTLRAIKKELGVSLSVPGQYHGTFKLYISVVDLLANSQSSINRIITLKNPHQCGI
jgi:hypothetical protein